MFALQIAHSKVISTTFVHFLREIMCCLLHLLLLR